MRSYDLTFIGGSVKFALWYDIICDVLHGTVTLEYSNSL